MQYAFFEKMYRLCGVNEFSRIFVLKVTLQSVRLLLTVSYRQNWGAGCTSCSPNNFVVGATALPAPPDPGFRAYGS